MVVRAQCRTLWQAASNRLLEIRGSQREVTTLADIPLELRYTSKEELAEFRELLDHVGRMLTRLLKRLEA